jgi:hypothetical protein
MVLPKYSRTKDMEKLGKQCNYIPVMLTDIKRNLYLQNT